MLLFLFSVSYYWVFSGDSLYNGKLDGTIASGDSIFMGYKTEAVTSDYDGFISDLVKSEDHLYFGISDLGLLIRKNSKGKLDTIINSESSFITLGKFNNFVIAGLTPQGKILFIKDKKIVDSLILGSDHIYSICEWNNKLIIGTGPEGKIYTIDESKKVDEFYKTEAHSVTELLIRQGKLFAGTSNPGLVYEFESIEYGRIYYDTGLDDINGLGFCGDTLCISGISSNEVTQQTGEIKFLIGNREFDVYRGTPILCGTELNNKFYAGESEDGQIGEFHRDNLMIIADFKEPKITYLKDISGDLYIGTGYPAKIYYISKERRKEGSYISSVFDGGIGVIWGNIFYKGTEDVEFFIRSGRKKDVDSSWTRWKRADKKIDTEDSFIQWKAVIKNINSFIKEVRISYGEKNSPPEIKLLSVLPPSVGAGGIKNGPQHREFIPPELKEKLKKMGFFIPEQSYYLPEDIRCIYWESVDPDGDRINFDVLIKRKGEEFRKLTKNLEDNAFFLDSSTYPEGIYVIKLVARDIPDRPSPLREEKITEFLIDHTSPLIENIEKNPVGDSVNITGRVSDRLSAVISILYKTSKENGKTVGIWRNASSIDGLFDENQELFSFNVSKDTQYIAIRAIDRSNNKIIIRINL